MSRQVFVLNGVEYGFMARVYKCRVLSVEPFIDSDGCCFATLSFYPDGIHNDYFLDRPPRNLFYVKVSTEEDFIFRVFFRRADAIRFVRSERRKWCNRPFGPLRYTVDNIGDEVPF